MVLRVAGSEGSLRYGQSLCKYTQTPALSTLAETVAVEEVADGATRGRAAWEREFDRWLAPFWAALGDKRRAPWAPVYVHGLLGPGERKSVGPMAARVAPGDYAQLHHFVCTSCWDPAPLEAVLAAKAQALVGVPDARLAYRTKGAIALAELERLRAAGVTFGCVLADTGHGASAEFRRALTERGLTWAVGVPSIQKVYPADVRLRMPRTQPGGRPRVHPAPTRERESAKAVLALRAAASPTELALPAVARLRSAPSPGPISGEPRRVDTGGTLKRRNARGGAHTGAREANRRPEAAVSLLPF